MGGGWGGSIPHFIAFRHLPPNSARTGYATEGALFISAQLSQHSRCQRPPKGLGTNKTVETTQRPSTLANMRARPPRVKRRKKKKKKREEEFRLNSIDFDFISADVSNEKLSVS